MVRQTNTKKQQTNETAVQAEALAVTRYTFNDFKNAALIMSVLINAFIFTAWLTLQVTDRYNAAVISFLVR